MPFRSFPSRARTQRGFGASDLIVAVALVAMVLAAGLPFVGSGLRTYQRNGAARQVLAEIRFAKSVAVSRGGTFLLQWGAASGVGLSASRYRIVRDATAACSLPAVGTPKDDINVIVDWRDLADTYGDVTITSIRDQDDTALGGIMFDALGASTNTCKSVNYPILVTVSDGSGVSRTIEVGSAGTARLL